MPRFGNIAVAGSLSPLIQNIRSHRGALSGFSLGYVYDIALVDHLALGLGAMGTVYALPSAILPAYGSSPASYMLFTRIKIK